MPRIAVRVEPSGSVDYHSTLILQAFQYRNIKIKMNKSQTRSDFYNSYLGETKNKFDHTRHIKVKIFLISDQMLKLALPPEETTRPKL